jgi:hypothetical protein
VSGRHRLSAAVRTAVVAALLVTAGCSSDAAGSPGRTPAGCGLVPAGRLVALLGVDVEATLRGSLRALRGERRTVSCRSVVPGHRERFVTITAEHHPDPLRLPPKSCSEGWVYAGTPEKFTPACQETVDGHGRTMLIVRWQPYVMRVTIGRSGRDWAGDPEQALALSRLVAQRLDVAEASEGG